MDFNTAKTHVTRLRSELLFLQGTKIAYELRDGLMRTGIDLFTNDLFQEAVEYFTEVVRLVCVLHFDREAYFYQAKCFYKLADYVQARACCTEVLNRSLEDDDEVQKLLESINAAQKTKAGKKGTKKKKSQGKSKEIAGPKSFPSFDVKAAMDATYSRRGSTNKETKVQAAPGARPNKKGLIQKSGPSKDSNSTNKSKGTDLGFSRDARSSRSREPTPPCRSSFVQDVSEKDYLSHFDDSLDSNWDVPITKPETTDELSKQEDGWILVTKNQKPKSVRESISYVNRRTFQSSKDSDQFQQLQNTGNLNRTDFDPFLDRRDSSQRDLNSTDLDRDPLERPSFIPTGLGSSGMPYISSKPHSDTSEAMITECLGNTPKSPWESLEQISRPLKMRQTLGLVKSTQNATLSNKQKPAEQAPNAHASYQMKANSKKDLPEDVFPLCEHFLKKGQPSQFPKPCSRCAENSTLLYGTWSRTTREWQLMRPYPKEVNLHVPFQLCWHFTNGVSCQKRPCTFAHGEKELMLWTMERQSDHDSFRRPVAGPTVSQHEIDDNMPKPQERIRGSLIIHDMRTDKPRPPPAGVYNGNFQLCKWWKSGRRCRFGSNCTFAHGYEELRSWMGYTKEIHEMRIKEESSCQSSETNADISRNKSEIQKLTSKEESSFQKSEPNADVSRNEMVYVLPGVEVSCNKPVSVKIFHRGDERRHTFHWIFTVSFEITDVGKLCQIDLLHRYHECYRFTEVKGFHNDIEIFSSVPTERWSFKLPRRSVMKEAGQMKVAVSVSFETTTFNRTSTQCLKFDFGKKPYLIQGLNVDLADMETLSKISTTRKELELDPSVWTDGSVEIVPSPEKSEMSDRDRLILEEYMLPARIENVVSAQIIDGNMTIDNYKRVMHQLLFTEELFMKKAISSFRLQSVTMYCQQRSGNETTGQAYAENGDLFGFLKFQGNESIQPDDAAGRLLFRYVKSAWIKRAGSTSHKVYEVLIQNVESETVSVTLKLPYQTCLDLQLTNATCSLVDVQFQLNREPLCEWHAAIDRLGPIHLSLLFPTPSVPAVVYQEERQPRNCLPFDPKLNTNQTEVIQRILAPGNYSSPLVVFGPFGTGKTFTLNQAIRHLVTTKHNRILLCTHTNSAADIHVRLLHDYLTNEDGLRATTPLRIYQTNRRLNTDSEIAKKYGLIENNANVLPTREDVIRHRVVITTLAMSKHLLDLQLNHGFFTHILVDEAAQALEPKALIPLALAGPNTKVVFTGDHMQISPEVYSHYAKDWGLQRSLPERLFDHYYEKQQSDSGCVMYLTENYRCHPDILQFPSDNFYGKELIACSQHASHPRLGSLLFFSVCGVEEARENSYINTAEIEEVVKRVKELSDDWPVEWKKRDLSQIGVISAYMPQVRAIRTYLRRESKELKNVTVESVDNVQGKEFRAVFISTVRTSLTCQSFDRRDDQSQSLYWEFLSDPKLLNTAITRAMSLVAVVGDPVALCTAGGCRGNWRDYIRRCHQHGTLHGAPYNEIKKNIDAPLSKINLNPEAAVFVPTPIDVPSEGLECTSQPGDVSGFEENNDFGDDGDDAKSLGSDTDYLMTQSEFTSEGPSEDEEEEQKYPRNEEPKGTTPEVEEADNDAEQNASEGFGELLRESIEDETVFPKFLDKIIKALVEKCKETKKKEAGVRETSRNDAFPSLHTATASNNKRSKAGKHPDKRASKEKASYNDYSSEDYEICVVNGRQKVRLVNLGFHQTQSSRHQRLTVASRQDEFLDTQLLQRLLFERPDTYLRCTLRLNSEIVHTAFGEIADIQTPDIKIKGRVRGVFDMDDVVVEKTDFQPPSGDGVPRCQGKIAGVLNHIINPHERQYVCKVDYENPGVLIPINKSVSKLVNLSHEKLKGFPIYNEIRRGDEKPVNVKLMDFREVLSGKFLFLVQYLQWRPDCRSPLGIVIRKLPQGNTLTDSMKIVFAEHGVRESFSRESKEEVKTRFPPDWSIPDEEYKVRQRIDGAFTIDPESSKDLDDALTLEQLPGNVNRVGVHIADVSYFVEPGTQLDKEAFFRCTSYYPGHGYQSVPMLPRELSENHCSLLPGKDRLCISVFLDIKLSEEGMLIGQPQIERTVLRSACQLTYSEAQKVIDGQESSLQQIPGDVEENIRALSVLAQKRRKLRLRDAGCDHWSNNDNGEDFEAHELVEEMMILANEEIAKFLSAQIPDTPLRTQLPPKEHKRRDWVKQYGQFIKYSKFLRGFYSEEDLKKMTTEVSVTEAAEFKVQETVWIEICHAAESGDQAKLQKLICDESNHPQLAVANSQFRRIQPKSQYVCKQDQPAENVFHFSLGMPCYTHFTSPIRRYIDIQVHRLLLGLTSPGQSSNRTSEDKVAKVCRRSTFSQDNSRKFDRACSKLHLAAKLKENSRETTAVIASIEKEAVTLEVLNQEYNHLSKRQRRIKLSNLNPFAVNVTQEGSEIVLVWKLRLYIAPNQNVVEDVDKEKEREDVLVLLSQGLVGKGEVLNLPAEKWLQIVKALQEGKFKKLEVLIRMTEKIRQMHSRLPESNRPSKPEKGGTNVQHFYEKKLCLRRFEAVQVQMTAHLRNGVLHPEIQLFKINSNVTICVEHRKYPRDCFATTSRYQASRAKYSSVDKYVEAWKPVLAMEAATNAVEESDEFTIHHMNVQWRKEIGENPEGSFNIPKEYCESRQIDFYPGDFVCIRVREDSYRMRATSEASSTQVAASSSGSKLTSRHESGSVSENFWVGHGIIRDVNRNFGRIETLEITMDLHQSASVFPEELLEGEGGHLSTLTVIRRSLPHRRMFGALSTLPSASQLVQSICLGREPSQEFFGSLPSANLSIVREHPMCRLNQLNEYQEEAVKEALRKPLTLVLGPPGTGKTVTGVHIAYWFARRNKQKSRRGETESTPQVIYCGPSNKSVDVVAKYMLRIPGLKIVRVYGDRREEAEFPIPNKPQPLKSSTDEDVHNSDEDVDLKAVSLHHIIRSDQCRFAADLKVYESKFKADREKGLKTSEKEVKAYRKLIGQAEDWALRSSGAQIILCTCAVAGMPRIGKSCEENIRQCIVDECGMCMEPETLVPITCSGVKQVVLIGDHKQLQPVIQDNLAVTLGLNVSMFERLSERAKMLELQYRMQKDICKFPSDYFYEGRLKTDPSVPARDPSLRSFWPTQTSRSGKSVPLAFCHVEGEEDSSVIKTEKSNEQSKANEREVQKVVHVVKSLVDRNDVDASKIVILSPYREQRSRISGALKKERGCKDILVTTIAKSQGSEWDYVILSLVRSLSKDELDPEPSLSWLREHLGFLTDEHQMNVGLTRARKGLCIIGNKNLLELHSMWQKLIEFYEENNCLVNESEWPKN